MEKGIKMLKELIPVTLFFVGVTLLIIGSGMIDTPHELILQGEDNTNWAGFTLCIILGVPFLLIGAIGMHTQDRY